MFEQNIFCQLEIYRDQTGKGHVTVVLGRVGQLLGQFSVVLGRVGQLLGQFSVVLGRVGQLLGQFYYQAVDTH